jgi:hypothetical protein
VQDSKEPDSEEVKEARAALVSESKMKVPELPAPGKPRRNRNMSRGGVLTNNAEHKRQNDMDESGRKGKGSKRKRQQSSKGGKRSKRRKTVPRRPKVKAGSKSAAAGKEQKQEGEAGDRPRGKRRHSKWRRMSLSDDEAPPAAAQSSSSGNAEPAAEQSEEDEERELSDKDETSEPDTEVPLHSDGEEPEFERKSNPSELEIGRCLVCDDPVYAGLAAVQCKSCTGFFHRAAAVA